MQVGGSYNTTNDIFLSMGIHKSGEYAFINGGKGGVGYIPLIVMGGNLGLGTTTPQNRLDVVGRTRYKVADDQSGAGGITIDTNNGTSLRLGGNTTYSWIQSHSQLPLYINELRNNTIINLTLGNVGIGTANPTNKLDVNGTVHSKEVKVDMNGWSDFVFKKDYDLPTLTEVEKYIAEKGHLENIPSEEEVLKNGINLGEMNV